jgi:hypothetical protein
MHSFPIATGCVGAYLLIPGDGFERHGDPVRLEFTDIFCRLSTPEKDLPARKGVSRILLRIISQILFARELN